MKSADSGQACPGEDNCKQFQDAADVDDVYEIGPKKGRRMGKAHTCVTCPMLETKPGRGIATDADVEVIAWLERFDAEITAGRPLIIEDLTALQWECWVMWSNLKQVYERAHQQRIAAMLEAMIGMSIR